MTQFPDDTQRIAIVGPTGSGKTQAAVWHLARRRFDQMPWVIVDYKMDPLVNDIEGARDIDLHENFTKPGLYRVHPHPDDLDGVQDLLRKIWSQERTGLYVDEGYMICPPGRPNRPFRSLLTQGRSKEIPMMVLSQRPVWMDRFVYSESEFFQVFNLRDDRDKASVRSFVPVDLDADLPDYHSYYYYVKDKRPVVMKPVPDREIILQMFADRFKSMEKKRQIIFV